MYALVAEAKAGTAALRGVPAEARRLARMDAASESDAACAVCGAPFASGEIVVRVRHRAARCTETGEIGDALYGAAVTCLACVKQAEAEVHPFALAGRGEPTTTACVVCSRPMITRTSANPVCSQACYRVRARSQREAKR